MSLHTVCRFLIVAASLSFSACSNIPTSTPIAPTVKLKSVDPVKLGFREQELAFLLDVNNPNSYDLSIQSLSFIAKLEDNEVARGLSTDRVTLPALGNTVVEIIVSTRIDRVLARLLLLANPEKDSVNYDISGFVKLTNWPLRIPFNVVGDVKEK